MLGKPSDGEIRLKCTEPAIPEFPTILFGTQTDTGISYFDATSYIQKTAPDLNIRNFFVDWHKQITNLCEAYDIDYKDVYKINEQGHYLIEGNFVFLFISFVEPYFTAYMCDRMLELFSRGVVVSDSYIAGAAKARLSQDVLRKLTEDEKATETD